jgi:hypothetical protein
MKHFNEPFKLHWLNVQVLPLGLLLVQGETLLRNMRIICWQRP